MGLAAALLVSLLAAPDAKVELGRRLFFDRTVSRTGRVSCSSCHDPEHGFSDPRALSEDEFGMSRRHSQPLLDLDDGRPLHWDGEFANVREVLTLRFGSSRDVLLLARAARERGFRTAKAKGRRPDEHVFRDSNGCPPYLLSTGPDRALGTGKVHFRPWPVPLQHRLAEDDRYGPAFAATFGSKGITTGRIVEALEAYVLSLRTGTSPFDRLRAGDEGALTDAQRRGLDLFTGKANCAACHTATGARPRLSDGGFHNTGVAYGPMPFWRPPDLAGPKPYVARQDLPLLTMPLGLLHFTDAGAGDISFVDADWAAFRTPSLREVARRGPYMHDGSLGTLEEVVRYYDRGGFPNENLDERIKPLGLTEDEVADLVAFLGALTGDERPGIGPVRARDKMRVVVTDLRGKPIPGLHVEIRPAGDRLEGGRLDDPPEIAVTNDKGLVGFHFPCWTHVQLTSDTHEIHYDWLIPDCAPPMEVMAAPRDTVALKLRVEGTCTPDLVARWAGSDEVVARFRRVRKLSKFEYDTRFRTSEVAIYVADRRRSVYPWVSAVLFRGALSSAARGAPREVDLSGGWTDPIDERPGPKE